MKKAGKIITVIFASICIVASLVTLGMGFSAKVAQEDPDKFREAMAASQGDLSAEEQAASDTVTGFIMEMDGDKVMRQGIIGAILSVIILITVLINIGSMPVVMPAIASVATVVGMVLCGIVILCFMVPVLIGCLLVLVPSLQSS